MEEQKAFPISILKESIKSIHKKNLFIATSIFWSLLDVVLNTIHAFTLSTICLSWPVGNSCLFYNTATLLRTVILHQPSS